MLSPTATALLPLLQPLPKGELKELFSLLVPQEAEPYMSIKEAARRTGLSHMAIRRQIYSGALRCKHMGARCLVRWSDIEAILK